MSLGERHHIILRPTGGAPVTDGIPPRLAMIQGRRLVDRETSTNMVAYVTDVWPESFDSLGVAYPGGLVSVNTSFFGGHAAGSYPNQLDTTWEQNSTLVPGILPGGYTARLVRDIFAGTVGTADQTSGIYRNASGKVTLKWKPAVPVLQRGVSGSFANSFGGGDTVYFPSPFDRTYILTTIAIDSIGWRKFQFQYSYTDSTGVNWSGGSKNFVDVDISHNANGTAPAPTADGDTSDFHAKLEYADFTHVGNLHTSKWVDCGAVMPAFGVASTFKVKLTLALADSTGGSTGTQNNYGGGLPRTYYAQQSPNLSVPLWFTCTGESDRIAPGGVV